MIQDVFSLDRDVLYLFLLRFHYTDRLLIDIGQGTLGFGILP